MDWNFKTIVWLLVWAAVPVFGAPKPLKLADNDRILVLAPHPDDEVLGCAGVVQTAVARKLPLRVVFLTNGDSNQWSFWVYRKRPVLFPAAVRDMGKMRHNEALAAAKELGVPAEDLRFLGYPDFSTLEIWFSHWGKQPPARGLLTRATAVPYSTSVRPGAPYKGEEILTDLEQIIREFRPTKVFVSHPSDHNGDHRALYLFARVATWNCEKEGLPAPTFLPYLVHFSHWPDKPEDDQPFITPPSAIDDDIAWQQLALTDEQLLRKRAALRAHKSQYSYSSPYLKRFVRRNELFGDFPPVNLENPASAMARSAVKDVPAELTEEERHRFVGVETRIVHLDGDALVYTFGLSRPLAYGVEAAVALCGYRSDQPFAKMPKLTVKVGELGEGVFNNGRRLDDGSVTITRTARQITVRVPLALLGHPQRLLASARTFLGEVPFDWAAWRVLELPATR